jgi:hypothetical protein
VGNTSSVRDDLAAFLAAEDLDELLAAREAITSISKDDAMALHDLVAAWSDEQAVANLLMYPELIPPVDRAAALAEGLSGARGEYAVLAAAVGLSSWIVGEDDAPAVAERLLALVEDPGSPRPTAMRAAIALGEYAEFLAPVEVVSALARDDDGLRHNVLAAALLTWGPVETLAAVHAAAAAGRLDATTAAMVEHRLADADLTEVDEPIEDGRLVVPLLAAIPDRAEWSSAESA